MSNNNCVHCRECPWDESCIISYTDPDGTTHRHKVSTLSDHIKLTPAAERVVQLERELKRLEAESAKGANWKADLDHVAQAVYPNKLERFTYSVDFMIDEINKLRKEREHFWILAGRP